MNPLLAERLTEADYQSMIVARAEALGWLVHHDRGDYRQCIAGQPGFPDLVMARCGRVVFAEIKSATGKVSKAQTKWLTELGYLGESDAPIEVYLWRPADWPQVVEVLA